MNVVTKKTLMRYIQKYPEAASWLLTWYETVEFAEWNNFSEVKLIYPSADQLADNRVVFNVKGNQYRLIVRFSFKFKLVQIKWFGRHKEYDQINLLTVQPEF